MRILMVSSDNNMSSGAFRSMVQLVSHLIDYGNEVLVVLPSNGSGTFLLEEKKIHYRIIKSFDWIIEKNPSFIKKIKRKVRMYQNIFSYHKVKQLLCRFRPDVVHINTSYHYLFAKFAIKKQIKIIWHIREFLEEDQNKMFFNYKKSIRLMNKSAAVIAISKAIFKKYYPIFKEKTFLIYNGIAVDEYFYEKQLFNNEKIAFLFVGGITEKKGQYDVLNYISKLENHIKNNIIIRFVGAASKEKLDKFTEIVKNNGLENNVEYLGKMSDVRNEYKRADVLIVNSFMEAFGRVTVEGMLSGCLVMGANSGGTSEILTDDSGMLYEYGNADDFNNKIRYIYDHKNIMKSIAINGQKRAFSLFNSNLNATQINELYKKILNV